MAGVLETTGHEICPILWAPKHVNETYFGLFNLELQGLAKMEPRNMLLPTVYIEASWKLRAFDFGESGVLAGPLGSLKNYPEA